MTMHDCWIVEILLGYDCMVYPHILMLLDSSYFIRQDMCRTAWSILISGNVLDSSDFIRQDMCRTAWSILISGNVVG